eukprot:251370_1
MYLAIFSKSSNRLQFAFTNKGVYVSQETYQNLYAINLDTQYHWTLYRTQQHITITVNGEKVVNEASPSHSVVFDKHIYVSNPWHESANATVSNLFISTSNSHSPNEFNYLCDADNRFSISSGRWLFDTNECTVQSDDITHTEAWNAVWLPIGAVTPLIESLPYDAFDASSSWGGDIIPYNARRTSEHAWHPLETYNPDYLQVDLGEQHPIESVSVFPRATGALQYVTTYTLSYSIDGQIFEDYPTTLNGPIGITGDDAVDEANSVLDSPIVIARYLRFTPLTYVWHKAMRVEAYRRDYYDEFQFDFNQNRLMNKKMNICTLGMDANDTRFVLIDNTTIDGYAALFDCNNSYALRSASITITYHELYYVFQKKMLDFDDSDALCRFSYDSHLASIHSDHQNEEAIGMSVYHQTAPPCWFGLNDIETEGTWTNRDATPWDYGVTVGSLPWNTTQPSGSNALNCATLAPRWSDSLCQ